MTNSCLNVYRHLMFSYNSSAKKHGESQGHTGLQAHPGNRVRLRAIVMHLKMVHKRVSHAMATTLKYMKVVTWIAALICIVLLTVYVGFDHLPSSVMWLRLGLRFIQCLFLVNITVDLLWGKHSYTRYTSLIMWIVRGAMLLTFLPLVYPHPLNPWIPFLERFLYSRYFLYGAMSGYSLIILCYGLMGMVGRRTNPALMMAGSFVIFILIGSLVLLMPKCTYHGIDYMDSLFVTTSAVCITGLTPVDIATTFTPLGQTVLCILFQTGGLGIITFTSFFAIFFSGRQSIYSQLLIKDMVYSKTLNSLLPTVMYILAFTLCIEAVGAFVLFFTLPESLCPDFYGRVGLAVFHSLSAFCNVGFSNIDGGMANAILMNSNQSIYIVMSVLLFAGGIGFPILVNFKDIIHQYWSKGITKLFGGKMRTYPRHIFDLNTKLVFYVTLIILVAATICFFLLESDNTLRGMDCYKRWIQSLFNSLIPRSGGYSTVNPADFMNITFLIIIVQMWIGGASQSLAGGVKVNTIGAVLINLRAIIRQHRGVSAFHRNIAIPSIRRANAVITLSLITVFTVTILLMLLQPEMSAKSVIFESISATFSVGSSLGITSSLGVSAKLLLCVAMFVGRVGLLSLLTGIYPHTKDRTAYYPEDDIIIT